LQTW